MTWTGEAEHGNLHAAATTLTVILGKMREALRHGSTRTSGREHSCRSNRRHSLPKGAIMLVIKEGQDERHYCIECGSKFIATARARLSELEAALNVA